MEEQQKKPKKISFIELGNGWGGFVNAMKNSNNKYLNEMASIISKYKYTQQICKRDGRLYIGEFSYETQDKRPEIIKGITFDGKAIKEGNSKRNGKIGIITPTGTSHLVIIQDKEGMFMDDNRKVYHFEYKNRKIEIKEKNRNI
ncbi:MAG: hypothetical protein ACI4R8_02070 [Candidatus Caccovivens sp.]